MNAVAAGIMNVTVLAAGYIRNPVLFFLPFSHIFLTKRRAESAVFKTFRGMAKVNCILIFFQFFLFTDRVNPLGRGECLNGDRLLRRKEGKKRGRLGMD